MSGETTGAVNRTIDELRSAWIVACDRLDKARIAEEKAWRAYRRARLDSIAISQGAPGSSGGIAPGARHSEADA